MEKVTSNLLKIIVIGGVAEGIEVNQIKKFLLKIEEQNVIWGNNLSYNALIFFIFFKNKNIKFSTNNIYMSEIKQNMYLAKINIPLIQHPDGNLESLTDNIHIFYEEIDKIPPLSNTKFTYNSIKEQLLSFLESKKEEKNYIDKPIEELVMKTIQEPMLKLKPEEIKRKPKKHIKNSSFKQQYKNVGKYTQRNYFLG